MCSDPSKIEMKGLLERFPLGKNRNRSSRMRFVLFVTSVDGNIALSVLFRKTACCFQYRITLEATYRSYNGSYFDG